jgi:hypothetical protein
MFPTLRSATAADVSYLDGSYSSPLTPLHIYLPHPTYFIITAGSGPWNGLSEACRVIFREDGIRGFYRGCGTNLLRTTPAAALTFTSFELIARALRKLSGAQQATSDDLPDLLDAEQQELQLQPQQGHLQQQQQQQLHRPGLGYGGPQQQQQQQHGQDQQQQQHGGHQMVSHSPYGSQQQQQHLVGAAQQLAELSRPHHVTVVASGKND